jgi:galactokinase
VLGGIADYSGALVVALPARPAAFAAAQSGDDGRVVVVSGHRRITLPADQLAGLPIDVLARRLSGGDRWAAYALGPVALLIRQRELGPRALRLLVASSVPEGKGLGSSAAVEVAALAAVGASLGQLLSNEELASLAQRAEHTIAGAPCGAMDQTTAVCGEEGKLLALLCRPAEVRASLHLPDPLAVWAIDSGTSHTVAGAAYRRVRCAAFMGKKLLGWPGHLAELPPSDVDIRLLPQRMAGTEFLRAHGGVDDPFSLVEPDVSYAVRASTLHPIQEHLRVETFTRLLAEPLTSDRVRILGELMYQSHAGYSRCDIGTDRADAIVDAVRRAGWERGLAGARLSGGGSGGAVVVLGRADAEPLVAEIAERLGAGYAGGSSPGAASFGVMSLAPDAPRSLRDEDLAVSLAEVLEQRPIG